MTEATIASWLKHEGDIVEAGEPLVELETDKVNVDVAAERSGILTKIVRAAGDTVQPGEILAMVSDPTAEAASAAAAGPSNGAGAVAEAARPSTAEARDWSGRTRRRWRGGWPTSTVSI